MISDEEQKIILHEASMAHRELARQYIGWSLLIGFAAGAGLTWWVLG